GVRCADTMSVSVSMPNSAKIVMASCMTGMSEMLPMIIATFILLADNADCVFDLFCNFSRLVNVLMRDGHVAHFSKRARLFLSVNMRRYTWHFQDFFDIFVKDISGMIFLAN